MNFQLENSEHCEFLEENAQQPKFIIFLNSFKFYKHMQTQMGDGE
jgi:hypothetical protein